MLYVFLVNNGTMMTFDMELALETVENLRLEIFRAIKLPPSNQVLLVSGGEILNSRDRVCKYTSAGTDTSPIYLFSKIPFDFVCSPETDTDDDLSERVLASLKLDANYNTVILRTELSDRIYDSEKSIIHSCEKILSDQHLQHQGWASVVCNLDDISRSFTYKANKVVRLYTQVLENQAHYQQLLDNFEADKETLKQIPLLKVLNASESDDFSKEDEISLYDWIQKKDPNTPIDELYCYDELITFDAPTLESLKEDILDITKSCNNNEMKEIKGLASRLSSLDKLMADVKKLYDRQNQYKKSFSQNQARLSHLADSSIIPDLCQSHKESLQIMFKNHTDLIDFQDRFYSAKRELCKNIHKRLEWIIHVEEKLRNGDEGLMKIGFRLTKIREKMDIIQSLHLSPEIYLSSIAEVMRRKQFSTKFYRWAQETSEYARKIVESETCQRRLFTSVSDKHFTKWFFPGMNDLPSNFADPPVEIDKFLPKLTTQDLETLSQRLPDMKRHLQVASTFEIPQFDFEKSTAQMATSQQVQVQSTPKLPHFDQETITSILGDDLDELKKQRDESEEKIREYGDELENYKMKIEQLELETEANRSFMQRFNSTRSEMLSTLQTVKVDLEGGLKTNQQLMKEFLEETVQQIYKHLEHTKDAVEKETIFFNSGIEAKNQQISEQTQTIEEHEVRLKETQNELESNISKIVDNNNLILSQECEIEQLRSNEEERKHSHAKKVEVLKKILEKVKQFKQENSSIKSDIKSKLLTEMTQLREDTLKNCQTFLDIVQEQQIEAENKALKEHLEQKDVEIEKIKLDHKNEIESLKHRFKLAINTTSIQRTESETSLEKVQLDIVDHSAVEKEMQKLSQALHEKKIEYEQSMVKMKNEYDLRVKAIKVELEQERMTSSIMVEGQEQIMQRMKLRVFENMFATLVSHFNSDTEAITPEESQQKLKTLKQLVTNCSSNLDNIVGSQSFIAIPNTMETSTQQEPLEWFASQFQELSTENDENFPGDDRVNLNSCEIGNNVFVHFHPTYQQFAVFQKNSFLHFVHPDSMREFQFSRKNDDSEWFLAQVLEKEFCMTKKAENRYKLPVDTKFYRVRVKQLTKFIPNSMFEYLEQAFNMSQSIATSSPSTSGISGRAGRTGSTTSEQSSMSHSVNMDSSSKRTF